MSEEFDVSADTSSFDDVSTDITDTDSYSDSIDFGDMMDDISVEPIDGFEAEPIKSEFVESDFSSDEIGEVDSLMDAAAEDYYDADVLDTEAGDLDSSNLTPTDTPSDLEDYDQDAAYDIADLDEAGIEAMDDISSETADSGEMADDNIESIMNDTEIESLDEVDASPDVSEAAPEINPDIDSLLNETEMPAKDIPETLEDNSDTHFDITNEATTESADISALMDETDMNLDLEPYKATPISEIPIIQEDGSTKSLENIIQSNLVQDSSKDVNGLPVEELLDSTTEKSQPIIDSLGSNDYSKIDELKAEKEYLLTLKEQLSAIKQEYNKDLDSDEGVMVKVLKKDGSNTSIIYHDYNAELADLDAGISEWLREQETWALELDNELKQITENPNLSEAEKAKLIEHNNAKRDILSRNYQKELSELQTARNELLEKITKNNPNRFEQPETVELAEIPQIEDISGWINDINPNYDSFDWQSPFSNNCGSCAFAVAKRLDGDNSITATSENIGTVEEMNKATGMEQVSMSPEEIQEYLIAQGPGAHGIVGIDRVSGPGHWFNAYYDGQKVVAIDGQTGEIKDWPPDYGDVTNWDISVRKEKK